MDLAILRAVIRSMVHTQQDQAPPSMPWHTTEMFETFRQLSPTQQASVRTLARRLQHANGDIGAFLPADRSAEWC